MKAKAKRINLLDLMKVIILQLEDGVHFIDLHIDDENNTIAIHPSKLTDEKPSDEPKEDDSDNITKNTI